MSNAEAAPSPGPEEHPQPSAGTAEFVDSAAQLGPADDSTADPAPVENGAYDPAGGYSTTVGYHPNGADAYGADGRSPWDRPGTVDEFDADEFDADDLDAARNDSEDGFAAGDTDFEWVDPDGAAPERPATELGLFGGDAPEQQPRRHIGRYVALAGAALVIGAAVVTGPTLWRVYAARHTTLTLPTEIAGMTRDTAGDSQDTADYLRDAVSSSTSLSKPLGAVYDVGGDAAHSVLVFGGTGSIFRPDHTLGTVLGLLDDSSDAITGLHTVPAGPLGGTMKCGTSVGSGEGPNDPLDPDMPICGWADHGSSAAALFPGRTVDQAADLMRQFRAAMEKK